MFSILFIFGSQGSEANCQSRGGHVVSDPRRRDACHRPHLHRFLLHVSPIPNSYILFQFSLIFCIDLVFITFEPAICVFLCTINDLIMFSMQKNANFISGCSLYPLFVLFSAAKRKNCVFFWAYWECICYNSYLLCRIGTRVCRNLTNINNNLI